MQPGMEPLDSTGNGFRLHLESAEPAVIAEHLRAMVQAGLPVVEFRHEERRLEDAFVDVLRKVQDA